MRKMGVGTEQEKRDSKRFLLCSLTCKDLLKVRTKPVEYRCIQET